MNSQYYVLDMLYLILSFMDYQYDSDCMSCAKLLVIILNLISLNFLL